MTDWLVGCLAGWLAVRLAALAGWLANASQVANQPAREPTRLAGWLAAARMDHPRRAYRLRRLVGKGNRHEQIA